MVSSTSTETMTIGQFRSALDYLGFSQQDVARILDVQDRSVRRWLAGSHPLPPAVQEWIETAEKATTKAVDELVDSLSGVPLPADIEVPRTDEEMWASQPHLSPFPARWYRHLAYRAAARLPGLRLTYRDELVDPLA